MGENAELEDRVYPKAEPLVYRFDGLPLCSLED